MPAPMPAALPPAVLHTALALAHHHGTPPGLARTVLHRWLGPDVAIPEALPPPAVSDPDLALPGRVHQRLLQDRERQTRGAFYTPATVARQLVGRALPQHPDPTATVWDPACGDGAFLRAAAGVLAERLHLPLREVVARHVCGTDRDPVAVFLCRWSLWLLADPTSPPPPELERHIVTGDGLRDAPPLPLPLLVAGNPPFLNQLEAVTAHDSGARQRLRHRFGAGIGAYTDTSALFLLAGLDAVRPGGAVALIQPRSLLVSRDAGPVRAAIQQRGRLAGLWLGGRGVFDAGVDVCAPVVVQADGGGAVSRWQGPEFQPLSPVLVPPRDARTWGRLQADALGLPTFAVPQGSQLHEFATATADFRDQYYGLQGCLTDAGTGDDRAFPPLVTSGLIDLAVCHWGSKPTRVLKQVWQAPRVDRAKASANGLGAWTTARLVPKIVLPTQTRVLEPWVDAVGRVLPSVPCLTIVPRDPARLWHVAAALASPLATAVAVRDHAGAALHADAIKLAAREVQLLPTPQPGTAWDEAAAAFRAAQESPTHAERASWLDRCAEAGLRAHDVDPATAAALLDWWRARWRVT
jgi:hypothetical protein